MNDISFRYLKRGDFNSYIFSGINYFFFRYVFGFFINFVGTIIIVRKGGQALWGLFAISQFILTVFAFLSLGCWGYLIQSPTEPTKDEIGNCYCFQSLISASWACIILILAPFLSTYFSSKELTPLLFGTVLGGFFYSWRYIACGLSERKLLYRIASVAEISDILIFNGIAVFFSLIGDVFHGILLGNILRGFGSALVAQISLREKIFFRFNRKIIKLIKKFSLPFIGYNTLQWLPINAGPIIAGGFLNIQDLGVLQLSYKTAEYPRVFVTIASRLSLNIFSRIGNSINELQGSSKKAIDLLFFLLIPGLGLSIGLSPIWIPFIYGDPWLKMSNIMMVIVFPFLSMSMISLFCSLLNSQGIVKGPFIFFIIYNIIYWPTIIILTKKFGLFGLPISEWVVLISCTFLLRELKRKGFSLRMAWEYIISLSIITLIIFFVWYLALHHYIIISMFVSGITTIIWLLKSPVKKEVKYWIIDYFAPRVNRKIF
jgi:O-antigen/teichoic acid export membrane protein